MKKLTLLLLSVFLVSQPAFSTMKSQSEAEEASLHMFPDEMDGFTRHVIRLPKLKVGEATLELIPAKTMMADCNQVLATVSVEKKSIQGWGYSYYVISGFKIGGATKMACPSAPEEKQVAATNKLLSSVRYNHRLPIVVFIENDLSLSYKIWRVSPEEAGIAAPKE